MGLHWEAPCPRISLGHKIRSVAPGERQNSGGHSDICPKNLRKVRRHLFCLTTTIPIPSASKA